jgi:diaminohydroxyphosphoribosylaminopyrimidine deaminase/5-amino-6-(5-phosphoribosylamino)uracil reductase
MTTQTDYITDEKFMTRALNLAEKGVGKTHPNPTVGAVVVTDGEVVGEGWHEGPGQSHAEVVALEQAGSRARGGTLYVTLEPCASQGRTPPCAHAILRAGIWRVVYASSDPNPKMAGGGAVLESHGVEVRANVLEKEADAINKTFFHFYRLGRAYVTAKAALSLDGKLATHQRHSQWISNEVSRRHAHQLRASSHAILIGAGTLKYDNPSLTVRDVPLSGEPPLRCVLCFETPAFHPDCKIADGSAPSRLYVRSESDAAREWRDAGVEVVRARSLIEVLKHLADEGRWSVLLEGGGILHAAFIETRLTDELVIYQAPVLIGGKDAVGFWQGTGVARVSDAPRLENVTRRMLGGDQVIQGRVVYPES